MSVIQCIPFKSSLMYSISLDSGRFMKNFRLDTICNIIQEPQDLRRFKWVCWFSLLWSNFINCCQISINAKSRFEQLSPLPLVKLKLPSAVNLMLRSIIESQYTFGCTSIFVERGLVSPYIIYMYFHHSPFEVS